MNTRIVLSLSSVAILMGAATSFGLMQSLEWFFWLVLAIFSAYLIAKRAPRRPVGNGFLVGFLCGVLSSATESLFFDFYITNNPASAERLARMAQEMDPRVYILLSGATIGLAAGIVFGVLALLATRLETGRIRKAKAED
jgi:ABC-type transport system involved in cytochrome c biogenesis permease subunit